MARASKPNTDRTGQICRALRHAIMEQALSPGAKLPEDAIGERFGASRTIVRHALGQLAAEGLVELRRNRGAVVATPAWEEARDIFDIYLHSAIPLDPALLAEHGGDADAARLALRDAGLQYLFRRTEDTELLEVHLRNGGTERLYWKDLVSGALLENVVRLASVNNGVCRITSPARPRGPSTAAASGRERITSP